MVTQFFAKIPSVVRLPYNDIVEWLYVHLIFEMIAIFVVDIVSDELYTSCLI